MPPTPPAIETDSLVKRYGPVTAVDGLDLRVRRGEVFGFLGPNGAGKSTTIDVLLDFAKPTAGSATVAGLDAQADRDAVHERIGVLPENYGLYERLSGYDHLEFAVELKDAADDPDDLLDRVKLSADAAERDVEGYSQGMRQRLALALALVGDPDVLLLDEPTNGLDPNGARELRTVIREENERGATVFFSSHVLEQVETIADRVGIMNRGRLVAVDTLAGLRESLGTNSVVSFDVADPPDLDFSDVPDVTDVVVTDASVTITCRDPAAKLTAIDRVRDATRVTDVRISDSSLEDLFASYTDDATGDAPVADPAGRRNTVDVLTGGSEGDR
jgi:ABC-2 type transport system ATP-binding protein